MKYLGKKSLSSFIRKLLHVSWYVAIALAITGFIMIFVLEFIIPFNNPAVLEVIKSLAWENATKFQEIPLVLKIFFLPYFIAIMVVVLRIIKKAEQLFLNFENDKIFNKPNVLLISQLSKLFIASSILTFNLASLLVSLLLLIICEIFKNGAALQEEHDLTV